MLTFNSTFSGMRTDPPIYNLDCIEGSKALLDSNSVDLLICDPPFGIKEGSFNKYYARYTSKVLDGYVEAPANYEFWTEEWVREAYRVLRSGGSFYFIIGHTKLRDALNACHKVGFELVNHIVWKYNFGAQTTHKFTTSHYHVLYYIKPGANVIFNPYCRFGPQEKEGDRSLQYEDLEDVFTIRREQNQKVKNQNKLPSELIEKLILYSSNVGDFVVDFFLGNFTTAYVGKRLGRKVGGFELNKNSYDFHIAELAKVVEGEQLPSLKVVEVKLPENTQKPFTDEEIAAIKKDYQEQVAAGMKKGAAKKYLEEKYGRGKWAIINVLNRP